MKCPHCNSDIGEDSKFCKECGTSLTGDAAAHPSFTKTLETPSKGIVPGTTFAARYTIIEELGRGGMGVVYKAEDAKLKRTVAIKLLPPELTGDQEARERFIREAQSAAVLDHPNICTIYEVDEAEDKTFISMAYVDGQDLRGRVKDGPLGINEALDLAIQAAEGLAAAHSKGIIHRDIKSANIMVTKEGQAKIMDFGLAKFAGASMITREGVTMGTVAYMSPEQAQGKAVDHRSDIWSLGVVLYEMFGGRLPFQGETEASFLYSIVHEDPAPLKEVNPNIPTEVQKVISRALKKRPEDRYQTAAEMAGDLRKFLDQVKAEEAGLFNIHTLLRKLRKPKYAVPAVSVLLLITAITIWSLNRAAKIRWVKEVALPEIKNLIEEGSSASMLSAFNLVQEAAKHLSDSDEVEDLMAACSFAIDIKTEPQGAKVFMKEYMDLEGEWKYQGETPLEAFRIPASFLRWKFEKDDYETIVAVTDGVTHGMEQPDRNIFRRMDSTETIPPGMIRITGRDSIPNVANRFFDEHIGDFFVDKCEVSNKDFKEFIDSGGYRKKEFWNQDLVGDEIGMSWEDAIARFVDSTGRPGPAAWEAGDYPEGEDAYPVSGVSWYEAAAYAEWAGKRLPTIYHWDIAFGTDGPGRSGLQTFFLPLSNIGEVNPGLIPVGSSHAICHFGAYDFAGNVREWCWNESKGSRCVRGGAWNDYGYMYVNVIQVSPFDRDQRNGFRCVQYIDTDSIPEDAFASIGPIEYRDFFAEKPVSDETYQAYKRQFLYDKVELNPLIKERDNDSEDWIKETILFKTAYSDEQMPALLFLPKEYDPPYQAVIFFPGSSAILKKSSSEFTWELDQIGFMVKTGRAVMFPIYVGTYERSGDLPLPMSLPNESHQYTEYLIKWVKDLKRSIDYLETRKDIDIDKLAYMGFSWGGLLANVFPAVEDRLKANIAYLGSLGPLGVMPMSRALPEADLLNYVTRVKVPTLMLNGKYDMIQIYEKAVKPMYDLLGTPEEDKHLKMFPTDHYIPRKDLINEILAFLDRYLGPVENKNP